MAFAVTMAGTHACSTWTESTVPSKLPEVVQSCLSDWLAKPMTERDPFDQGPGTSYQPTTPQRTSLRNKNDVRAYIQYIAIVLSFLTSIIIAGNCDNTPQDARHNRQNESIVDADQTIVLTNKVGILDHTRRHQKFTNSRNNRKYGGRAKEIAVQVQAAGQQQDDHGQ